MQVTKSRVSSFATTGCLGALLLAGALAGGQPNLSADTLAPRTNAVPADASLAISHGPFLQAPSETGITISWATTRKCVSRVEYRPESSSRWLTNIPAHHGLVDADVTRHNVPLTGLQPGSRYAYRVVSRETVAFKPNKVDFGGTVASPEYHFTTLDARKPSTAFIVVNDRHEKVAPFTASLASVKWADVDLVFLNGDMVSAVRDESQLYRCVVDPCAQAFGHYTPLVYVRGNHETRWSLARHLLDYFPTETGRYYYSFNHAGVAFLVLDGGEDKADGDVEYSGLVDFEPYLRQEVQWLARQIEEPAFQKARFRVCFLHIPPARKPNPKFIRPQWLLDNAVPLLNRGRVDLLICGHTHRYTFQPAGTDGLTFPLITGGAEMVIRCEVTADRIQVTTTDLSGKTLPQPPPVKARE
jgi:acid phosphatase type 7